MRVFAIAIALVGVLASCDRQAPTSVESVPVKFVVLSVVYGMPGEGSEARYGAQLASGMHSEVGARWRSLVRTPDGSERVAGLGGIDVGGGGYYPHLVAHGVTGTSGAVSYDPISGLVYPSPWDVPPVAYDSILIWVNPTVTVTTNFVGTQRVDWSWSESCFRDTPCTGGRFLDLTTGELDGTVPPRAGPNGPFLATLTDEERAAILRYHPLYDPPGRDPATLASDPRFLALGAVQPPNWPSGSVWYLEWTPCDFMATDAEFPVLAETEIPFEGGTLVVQHSVQSISSFCEAQQPHLTFQAGIWCVIDADLYLDRAFGTVLAVPSSVSGDCTGT